MTAIPGSCYLDPYKHRYSENGNKVLVQQAKSYLENSFKSYMENLVNENTKLSKADLQSTFHLVYNFVSIRFKGEYLGLEDGIRNCTDPFKRIVWATLGGCDEISEAARTEDDYLWFKLNLVRFDDWARGYETYTDLQIITLEKSGEKFSLPHVYPKLLFLTGQFEMAIDFLFRTEKFKDHAVHMAVALHELDFLICSEDTNSPLVQPITNTTAFSLNFALLLETHVLNLELDLLPSALNYLFLLRHLENWEGRNVFEMNMANLIIRTKEYVKILGKIEPPTRSQNQRQQVCHREKALIDQFKVTEMFKGIVTEIQQQILSKNDGWEELINFYQTVNDQESTMHFMCSMLSKVAHLENQSDSLRTDFKRKQTIFCNSGRLTIITGIKDTSIHLRRQKIYWCSLICIHIKWAWEQANTITNFAERLPKEIIGDTRERLIQMEILMHS
ncbi:hypothetical protein NQ317_012068 [Molorchus minor]|uniref:Nuclear pore protein n=1 Tax=Molorchus minor TaxID=1323400 RepID=A0ABQ9K717_9CUCU|nr:hypothetical protein NQ317_012068 [Molorchus minor]